MTMVEEKARTPEKKLDAGRVLEHLRTVLAPGDPRDVVTAGLVKEIRVEGGEVAIVLDPGASHQKEFAALVSEMRSALAAGGVTEKVTIEQFKPGTDDQGSNGSATLHRRPDLAPEAGYGLEGPEPLGGPSNGPSVSAVYEGKLAVLQWEIDPQDPDAKSGNADVTIGEWDFRMWWQEHASRLVYTSIQAMQHDDVGHGGAARAHPVGRMEAVNLVFDKDRKAVIAIYGTVRDFRPFVEAFYQNYVLKN